MRKPTGFGLAVMATASLAIANGGSDNDKKKGEKPPEENGSPAVQAGGWSGGVGEGLTYTSTDFSVSLRNGIQVQLHYEDNDSPASDSAGFSVERARTILSGFAYNKSLRYELQNEWNDSASIQHAWIEYELYNQQEYEMGVRVGQLKTRFGRDWSARFHELEFVDRSLATRTFSGTRTRGGFLYGTADNGKIGWSLAAHESEVARAAVNAGEEGDPRPSTGPNDDNDNELNYNFEFHWRSDGSGIEGAQGNLESAGQPVYGFGSAYGIANSQLAGPVDGESHTLNVWVDAAAPGGLAINGEFFHREESSDAAGAADASSNGWHIGMTWTSPKIQDMTQFGFGARFASVNIDDAQYLLTGGVLAGAANTEAKEFELAGNMFNHGHNVKTQLSLKWQGIEMPVGNTRTDNYLVALQTTFMF